MSTTPKDATLFVHAGGEPDVSNGSVVPTICLASTFAQERLGRPQGIDNENSHGEGFIYSRFGNPTRGAFERALAAVEHGKYSLAFASGMAASVAIVQLLDSGDHVLCIDDIYGGTQKVFRERIAGHTKIEFDLIDMSDVDKVAAAINDKTKVVWIESPTNPTLKITDIKAIAARVRAIRNDILVVVDNTFMSPYLQRPLDLGAHIVLHSVTKYIGGHSDIVMGALVVNDDDLWKRLRFLQSWVGAVPSPFDCYLALRGLRTLPVRMDAAQRNAIAVAKFLDSHEAALKVIYPGLESHPGHKIIQTQASGFGAMVTFYLNGGLEMASAFLSSLKIFILAVSLGSVESLAESPALMTHSGVPVEQRKELGISDNMIRLSIGIEDGDDLVEDLRQALEAALKIERGDDAKKTVTAAAAAVTDKADTGITTDARRPVTAGDTLVAPPAKKTRTAAWNEALTEAAAVGDDDQERWGLGLGLDLDPAVDAAAVIAVVVSEGLGGIL